MRLFHAVIGIASLVGGMPAVALTPSELFEKMAPSVWAVRAIDGTGRRLATGSGVVIGPGRMVTNCHVLAKAKGILVQRENVSYEAKLEHADTERDLCIVTIRNFQSPAVAIRTLADVKIGERVYAIGNPAGLSQTLSDGLVSGLRGPDGDTLYIQTTAPISPGSSGGGLFDTEGRLIGITTLIVSDRQRLAQNLNLAMPAEWIAEVPERSKVALANRRTAAGPLTITAPALNKPASAQLPAPGTTYVYEWRDRMYGGPPQSYTVRISGVDGWTVNESVNVGGESSATAAVDASAFSFLDRRLGLDRNALEFAPYLHAQDKRTWSLSAGEAKYPSPTDAQWTFQVSRGELEDVVVPGGKFRAQRVEVSGVREPLASTQPFNGVVQRFHYVAWYSAEVRRYVRFRYQTWNPSRSLIGDEQAQLAQHKAN